ncbi:DUF2231 domain-containing protein [Streptosporangium sp. NPDC023615]|uniref:DUF2231 domain-containing protein n=1 Tax=Streptosporangium sp. NPDC023615 TaxID=3154794 RepID=UPI00341F59A2
MFDEILGLPPHPLIVHAAVVLTPLLAVLATVYALAPRTRRSLAWAVAGLAPIVPLSVFAARQSGESLQAGRFSSASGEMGELINEHAAFGTPLLFVALGLGVASAALVHVCRGDRFGRPLVTAVSGLTVILAVVAVYYVVRAGHSGAVAVWGS